MNSPLKSDNDDGQLASLYASIEKINKRLDALEQQAPYLQVSLMTDHPSLDKLNVAEAIADSIFGATDTEKACTFEPSRPCDHCSMCNSRGF
jgi:hypothetical protein